MNIQNLRVAFLTLGCKVNYYETSKMEDAFKADGAQIVSIDEKADIYIINTCTVTNIADRKSRQMLHRARKKNPDSIIVACGCYVNSATEEKVRAEGVDICISNDLKPEIVKILSSYYKDKQIINSETGFNESTVRNSVQKRTRAYIKIQDGCNQYCSYCIIPYVRGVLRSRTPEDVCEEIENLAKDGYKEIVITGIHLSSYGVDFDVEEENRSKITANAFTELNGAPLISLLKNVSKIHGIERIRLGSIEPRIITEEFAKGLTEIKGFCPHFHLSLQSGCDTTLMRMNRHYTTLEYEESVDILRRYFDSPAITTDIIVGFAGETDEEFETTCAYAEKIGFSDIHVFKYSRRSGTVADTYPNQVNESLKHKRSNKLIDIASRLKSDYESQFLGKTVKVLTEDTVEPDGLRYTEGYTDRYVRVRIPLETDLADTPENELMLVTIDGVAPDGVLLGR